MPEDMSWVQLLWWDAERTIFQSLTAGGRRMRGLTVADMPLHESYLRGRSQRVQVQGDPGMAACFARYRVDRQGGRVCQGSGADHCSSAMLRPNALPGFFDASVTTSSSRPRKSRYFDATAG